MLQIEEMRIMIQKPYKHKKHNRCSKAIGSLNKNPNRTDKPPDLGKANISFSFSFSNGLIMRDIDLEKYSES